MNSERESGFRGLGGLYWTVVQELEDDLLAYLRWVLGQRPKMPRSHQNPSLKKDLGQQQSNAALSPGGLNYSLGGWGLPNNPLVKHEAPERGAL